MRSIAAILLLTSACGGADTPEPDVLSTAGLYSDFASRTLAPGVRPYTPTHQLWSDGAGKQRWLRLPEGAQIDTADMDRWVFPIGTKLFKEFSRDGVVVETRMIERTGPGPDDYRMVSYVYLEDGSDAVPAPDGVTDALGTSHDVPKERECWDCHEGEAGRVLGLSALLLPQDSDDLSLAELEREGRLTSPTDAPPTFPGTSSIAATLGYLHVNCGTCHNELGAAWEDTQLDLRVRIGAPDPTSSEIYRTSIDAPISSWRTDRFQTIVVPGDPGSSALLARMLLTDDQRMPPIGTELVDDEGVALIERWITALGAN